MRVIAGRFGGRRLDAPSGPDTRPVTDRVKEAVFSSLGGAVSGSRVADLYAGAGSFGIEALSRGAVSVTFVESSPAALRVLRHNLATLGLLEGAPSGGKDRAVETRFDDGSLARVRVVSGRVEEVVDHLDEVDLVFCDPPWPLLSDQLARVLERLAPQLSETAQVVVSRRASDRVPEPAGLTIDHDRRYGDARIVRYAKVMPTL